MTKNSKIHIKIGDTVQVIAGNQKGFIGTVNSIMRKKSIVFIDGIVPRIKYSKNPQGGEQKKLELQIPIHISNVMLWDKENNNAPDKSQKTTRLINKYANRFDEKKNKNSSTKSSSLSLESGSISAFFLLLRVL